MKTKHVLILGGGFAGLACAQKLNDERFRVTLVDRWNHRLFQPYFTWQRGARIISP